MSVFNNPMSALPANDTRDNHHVAAFGKTGSGKWVAAKDASILPALKSRPFPGVQP